VREKQSHGQPSTIVLVAIGEVDESLLPVIGEAVSQAFGRPWVSIAPLEHPAYAYDARRRQYLSSAILDRLRALPLPRTGRARCVGIVDEDLYVPELNFVFGQASLGGGEAVIALPRLRQGFYDLPENEALFRERTIKEAVHELGHTYGLRHCPDRRCVMHFSNSLHDTDVKHVGFCRRCQHNL